MRFVATDGVAWHHICYINDETAMRFVAQNALVWPYCLLNKSKTTIKIPLLTIHCTFNSPCADARAVRPYMPLTCKSFFNRTNPKVQSSKFNVQSQGSYMPLAYKLSGHSANHKVQNSMFKIQSQEPQRSKSKLIHAEKRFLNNKFILKQHKKMIKTNTITLFILPLQVSNGTQ